MKLLTVEGSIGTGKSTLLLRLKDRLAHDPSVVFVDERVSDWVHHGFLQRVYSEPAVRLAFQQMALTCLVCDLRRALSSTPAPRLIVMERSPFGNYQVFAKANLDGADLKMFKFTLDQLMTTLPDNLKVTFLYLRAHVTTLERRIQGRGRDAESGVTLPYLESLDQRHHHWLRKVNADGFHQVYELNANLAASDVFERVCQLDIPDLRVDQPGVIPEGGLTATSRAPPPSTLAMAATETAIAAAASAVALAAAASLSFLGDQLFTGPATDAVNMGEASIPSPPPSPPRDEFEEDGSASLPTRLISVRVDYPRPLDMPMAKVVVPTDLTVAQFVVRVQALLQDYTGERVATHAVLPLWQMKLASDTMTPLLFPPTPAGTPAHRRSWDPDKPINATGIKHHSVVTVSRIAQDSASLITVFVSCPNQARAGTPMAKIEVPAHLTVRQFAEAVQSTVFQGDLRWWPHPDLATWQIRVMPGNTVVEDAQSTLLCPPAAPSSTHLRPGGYGGTCW